MKLWKVETGETKIRIDQDIFNREGREVTRRGAEKMKSRKVEIGKLRPGSTQAFFTTDGDRMGSGWI